jgi:transposase
MRTSAIQLSEEDITKLTDITKKGQHNARTVYRAKVLLLTHQGKSKIIIALQLDISQSTVRSVRHHYREEGIDRAIYDNPRSGQPSKLTDKEEAFLIATACSAPPEGRDHWTMEMLQTELKTKKKKVLSTVAILKRLRKRGIKPWLEKNVVRPYYHGRV